MRTLFLTMLCLAIACTPPALAGEFYGTIKEGGKSIKAATKIEVKCAKGSYSADGQTRIVSTVCAGAGKMHPLGKIG